MNKVVRLKLFNKQKLEYVIPQQEINNCSDRSVIELK